MDDEVAGLDRPGCAPASFGARMEAVLLALVVGLAASMWLATIGAGISRFSPLAAVAGGVVAAGAAIVVPEFRRDRAVTGGHAAGRPRGADLLLLVLVAVFAARAWPPSIAWPAFLDGGWYAAAAAQIARQGALVLDVGPGSDPVFVTRLADQRRAGLGVPLDEDAGFHAVAFAVADVGDGTAAPYHPPFFSSWLAIFAALLGPARLGIGAWIWASAWAAALGVLARRTFGATAGVWAIVIAGLSPLALSFARQPFAELAAGALVMGALAILGPLRHSREGGRDLPAAAAPARWGEAGGSFVAGLLLGLAGLTKLDVVPAVAIAVAWWTWWSVRGRKGGGPGREAAAPGLGAVIGLWLGLVPAAVHGAALAAGPAAVYYSLNLWGVRGAILEALAGAVGRLGGPAGAVASAVAAAAVLVAVALAAARSRRPGPSSGTGPGPGPNPGLDLNRGLRPAAGRPAVPGRRLDVSAAILAVVAYGPAFMVALLWLRDRPGQDVAGPASLSTILVWAITPLGAWAALYGWAQLVRGRSITGGLAPSPIAPVALATAFVLAAPLVTRSLSPLYAGRRLLPVALPLACLLAAAVADRAWRRGGLMRLACAAGVAIAAASTVTAERSISPARDLAGARLLIDRLGAYGGPDDLFVFPSALTDEDDAGRLAAAVWALDGRPVAVVGAPEPDLGALGAAVTRILDSGRAVFWVGASPPPALEGLEVEAVGQESVITEVLAPDPGLPPRMSRFELSLGVHAYRVASADRP